MSGLSRSLSGGRRTGNTSHTAGEEITKDQLQAKNSHNAQTTPACPIVHRGALAEMPSDAENAQWFSASFSTRKMRGYAIR